MNIKEKNINIDVFSNAVIKVLNENEIAANRFFFGFALLNLIVIVIAFLVSFFVTDYDKELIKYISFLFLAMVIIASMIYAKSKKFANAEVKYVFIIIFLLVASGVNIYTVYGYSIYFALVLIVSCRYFNYRYTLISSILGVFAYLAGIILSGVIGYKSYWLDLNLSNIPEGSVIKVSGSLTESAIKQGFVSINDSMVISFKSSIVPFAILIGTAIVCCYIAFESRKLLLKGASDAEARHNAELDASGMRTQIMVSQIQPHFLYNALTAIMAIDGNPPKTINALSDFGKYLRENLNVLSNGDPIYFKSEMDHVKRYLSLEQLRFEDNLRVIYDITADDFKVPPLSIQMLVENAVKHGVTQREDGGTVTISTRDIGDFYEVKITDDGIGFDPAVLYTAEGNHIGMQSVSKRIQEMGGSLEVSSIIGKGTVSTFVVPKQQQL